MLKQHFNLVLVLLLLIPFGALAQLDVFAPFSGEGAQTNDFPLYLTWKAYTEVPPFYEGKPLPVPGSTVSIVAFAPTQNSSALTYFWELDDSVLGSQGAETTGRGEDTFIFATHPLVRREVYNVR